MLFFTRKRIPLLLGCGALLSALACLYGLYSALRTQAENDMAEHLLLQAQTIAAMRESATGRIPKSALETLHQQHVRLTIMSPDGTVVLETGVNDEERNAMDNHLNRPEIRKALASGRGTAVRFSNTMNAVLIYAAVPLHDGGALCLAVPQSYMVTLSRDHLRGVLPYMLAFLALPSCFVVAGLVIFRRYLANMSAAAQQIARGAYKRRLRFLPGEDFIPLAAAFNSMAKELSRQKNKAAGRKERLQAVLDLVPDGVLVLTRDGRVRNYNSTLERLFPEFSQSWGKPMLALLPKLELQKALAQLLNHDHTAPFEPGPGCEGVLQLEQPEGRFFQVHYGLNPHNEQAATVLLDDGSHGLASDLGAVLVFTDVTLLLRLECVRRDFVANVSHELRTPLTAIQGYAETIESLVSDGDVKRFSGIIRKQSGRLGRLVEELLELARLESCGLPAQDTEADVRAICQEVIQLLASRATAARAAVICDVPYGMLVRMLPDQLFQVLENLLDNALRYSRPDGSITVSASYQGSMAEVRVSDQGCGIQPGEHDRIFERFYKGRVQPSAPHATLDGRGESGEEKPYTTGLGLAICKHIIELYGGGIRAENLPDGHGAVFIFTVHAVGKRPIT